MEPFLKENNTVKGIEILFFEDAVIEKSRGKDIVFTSAGPLSVLHFSDYNRYVLQLNGWRYPLLRRLPILCETDTMRDRSYLLPTRNGFFRLRIEGASDAAFSNLETIFFNSSNFSLKGRETVFRNLEASPDDKLVRGTKKETKGFISTISDTLKHVTGKTKTAIGTLKTGTKGIESRKKMLNLKDIKNKNFKKEAKSTFKKDFFTTHEHMSVEFLKMRRENVNLILIKDFRELAKSTGPSLYIPKEELEEVILNNKELASKGNFNMNMPMPQQRRTGVVDPGKQGFDSLKQGFTTGTREGRPIPQFEKATGFEGMSHFQG